MEQENSLPSGEVRAPFSTTKNEKIVAFLMYLAAYVHVLMIIPDPNWLTGVKIWLTLFTALFVGFTELINLRKRRTAESWVWLLCTALVFLAQLLGREEVWSLNQKWFFYHVFAVWWCVSRGCGFLEGESGHLSVVDAVNAFIVFPFKNFFLRIRTVFSLFRRRESRRAPNSEARTVGIVFAVSAAVVMFLVAVGLLIQADAGFQSFAGDVLNALGRLFDNFLFRFLLSLPVGAYLFGLIVGTDREDKALLRRKGDSINGFLAGLGHVPYGLWVGLGAVFAALYAVFFFIQGQYLFGAFTRTLPEGFIVSEYARRGFFELCGIMAVNFLLLWCFVRTSDRPVRKNGPVMALCLVILLESVLFAVVAASKIGLYIDCFGFTPLRVQSMWLVAVLFAGCIACGYHIITGRKSMKAWMIFGAVSLSALCLW